MTVLFTLTQALVHSLSYASGGWGAHTVTLWWPNGSVAKAEPVTKCHSVWTLRHTCVTHSVTQCHTVLGLQDTLVTHSHPHGLGHKHWTATYPTCTLRLIYWLLEKPIWKWLPCYQQHPILIEHSLMCSYMHVKKSVWKLYKVEQSSTKVVQNTHMCVVAPRVSGPSMMGRAIRADWCTLMTAS